MAYFNHLRSRFSNSGVLIILTLSVACRGIYTLMHVNYLDQINFYPPIKNLNVPFVERFVMGATDDTWFGWFLIFASVIALLGIIFDARALRMVANCIFMVVFTFSFIAFFTRGVLGPFPNQTWIYDLGYAGLTLLSSIKDRGIKWL